MAKYNVLIKEMITRNKGILTSSDVTESGIPRYYLTKMLATGEIVRIERGIYILPEIWEDELFFLQYKLSRGIFSHETALFLHNMTDRAPFTYTMTFPSGYNTKHLKKKNIIVKLSSKVNYEMGVQTITSFNGNPIRVYDIDRTICDILLTRNNTDIQIITQSMQMYANSKIKNLIKLMEYADKLHIKSKVRNYMEILL